MEPLFISLSPRPSENPVEEVLHAHFGHEFTESDASEGLYTYTPYHPYDHIFRVRNGETEYLLKCSTDPMYDQLIKREYAMYQQLYSLPEFHKYSEYFLEGVEGGHDGVHYILFPYIESTTLEQYILTKPMPTPSAVCGILKKVKIALVFLLQNKMCHGDLHAGNVLIHGNSVKVIDFDKAGRCDQGMVTGYTRLESRNAVRQNVNFIGTPGSTTGFFVLCKDMFARLGIQSQSQIDSIIKRYIASSNIDEAYASITKVLDEVIDNAQRGKGRKKRRTQKQKKTRSKRSVL
jgi:serine/threonine protein kinase